MATRRVPTIRDLRVKLCYICREEEIIEPETKSTTTEPETSATCPTCEHQPEAPPAELIPTPQPPTPAPTPRTWTHPCTCTLIAHEDCLLKWIQTAQSSSSQQRSDSALKCPQCGTQYEIESIKPRILKVLTFGNKALQRVGRYCTVFGAASVVGLVGTSIYIGLTAYGAWAVEKFIGAELYQDILTDDPTNWPWSAYVNLPLIPLTLVLSRFHPSPTTFGIPHLLIWLPSVSASVALGRARARSELSVASNSSSAAYGGDRATAPYAFLSVSTPTRNWPPAPSVLALFGIPIVRSLYRLLYAKVYERVLGVPLPIRQRRRRRFGRRQANEGNANGGDNEENGAQGGRAGDAIQINEGPFVIRIRANVDGDDDAAADDQGNAAAAPEPNPEPNANQNPDAVAVEAAEQLIEINASSLGRRIGGALLIPLIASKMGSLLLRLSKHSTLLRMFLGIRPGSTVSALGLGLAAGGSELGGGGFKSRARRLFTQFPWGSSPAPPGLNVDPLMQTPWSSMHMFQRARLGLKVLTIALWGGAKSWVDTDDPVWWRNCVGFGLFVVLKDCVQLLHLWLAKRELESRKVKDRDFRGVDLGQLDLLPTFLATQ